jgi:hypothetical protein
MRPVGPAADRFFRAYYAHCTEPDEDTLFNLLNALHSFHDKFQKATGLNFFESAKFLALKALRNLFHHHDELLNRVKVVRIEDDIPLTTDLMVLCLVDRQTVLDAVDQDLRRAKRQALGRDDILGALKWYGGIANINPCVFNCAVEVFEAVWEARIVPSSPEFHEFEAAYKRDEEYGLSHWVTGDIQCRAGDVSEVVRQFFETA